MNKRITIIPYSGLVMIDGRGFDGLDMSGIPSNIHAVQWYGNYGEIEHKTDEQGLKSANERITSLDGFETVIAEWEAKQFEADNPPAPPAPTQEEIQAQLVNAVDAHMTLIARSWGYDSVITICTYGDTGNAKFDAEGNAFRQWRSAVYQRCYEILAEVMSGQRGIPTAEELIALLPPVERPT